MIRVKYTICSEDGTGFEPVTVSSGTGRDLIELKQEADIIHLDPCNLDELIEALQTVRKEIV